jgi:hypothetical protein
VQHKILNNLYDDLNKWANGLYNLQEMSMKVMDTAIELAINLGIDPDTAPPEDVQ